MKTIILCAGLATLPCVLLADIPLGRGGISTSATATATYDSNVFGTHDATGDFSGTIAPRISYARKSGEIEAEAHAEISFIRYLEQTQLNASNWDTGAALRIPQSDIRNYSGSVNAAYVESSNVNSDINTRVDVKTGTFGALADLVTGPRSDVSLSGNYNDTRPSVGSDQQMLTTQGVYSYKDFFNGNTLHLTGMYEKLNSSGQNSLGVPLDQNSYTFSAGLDRAFADNAIRGGISYGYRVLNRSAAETSSGIKRQAGPLLTITLDGPFLPEKYFPKIKSQLSLSYQDTGTPGINDPGTKEWIGNMLLAWQARENTKVSFIANRTQRLTVEDLTVVDTSVSLGVEQTLRYNLTGSLVASYDWSKFRTVLRQDKTASLRAGLNYHFARVWDANFSYSFNSTDSTSRQSTFDRHIVSLGVTYRF